MARDAVTTRDVGKMSVSYSSRTMGASGFLCHLAVVALLMRSGEAVKDLYVATMLPYSGQFANGIPCSNIYDMALEEVNNQEIVPGYRLNVIIRDSQVMFVNCRGRRNHWRG